MATHQEYQHKVEALGFPFHRLRPNNHALHDAAEMAKMMNSKSGTDYIFTQWLLPSLRDTYTDLLNASQGADLIISGEGVMATRLVAEQLQVSWVSVVLQPLSFLSRYDQPVLPSVSYTHLTLPTIYSV